MKTQGQKLIALLKRSPMTQMQINMTGISTSWHNRVVEALKHDPDLELTIPYTIPQPKGKPLNVYRVVRKSTPKTAWVGGKYPKE